MYSYSPTIQAERSSCVKTGLNNENIAVGVAIIKIYYFTLGWCFALPWNVRYCSKKIPQLKESSPFVTNRLQMFSNVFFLTISLWHLTMISILVPCYLIGYWHLVIKIFCLSLIYLSHAVTLVGPSPIQNGLRLLDQLNRLLRHYM